MTTKTEATNLKIYLRVRDIKSIIKYVEDKGYRPAKSFNTNKAYIGIFCNGRKYILVSSNEQPNKFNIDINCGTDVELFKSSI